MHTSKVYFLCHAYTVNQNLYVSTSKHFYSDNKSLQKISSSQTYFLHPLATWWLSHPLTALSVTPGYGHLAKAYHVFELSVSASTLQKKTESKVLNQMTAQKKDVFGTKL